MRELGDQHALDGDDSGADAVPEHADGARQPRYEAVHDPAARRASALEYRQRVKATYAAYDAEDARRPGAEVNHVPADHAVKAADGTAGRDDASGNYRPDRSGHAEQAQGAAGDEYAKHVRRGPAAEANGREPGPGQDIEGIVKPGNPADGPCGDDPADQAPALSGGYAGQNGGLVNSYRAGDAKPGKGHDPGEVATGAESGEQPAEPAARDTPPHPLPGQDAPEIAAPSREPEDSWPPSRADQDKVRKLYSDYLADMASADRQGGRDQGMNTVGPKLDRSPGEISGLPPSGDKLTEVESSRKSRFNELLREAEKEENLDGLHDAIEEDASTVQRWLSARPPEGHAEQPVPAPHPYITPWVPEHGIEGGDAASAVMVAGILTIHMARWIDDKLRHGKGDRDDSNG